MPPTYQNPPLPNYNATGLFTYRPYDASQALGEMSRYEIVKQQVRDMEEAQALQEALSQKYQEVQAMGGNPSDILAGFGDVAASRGELNDYLKIDSSRRSQDYLDYSQQQGADSLEMRRQRQQDIQDRQAAKDRRELYREAERLGASPEAVKQASGADDPVSALYELRDGMPELFSAPPKKGSLSSTNMYDPWTGEQELVTDPAVLAQRAQEGWLKGKPDQDPLSGQPVLRTDPRPALKNPNKKSDQPDLAAVQAMIDQLTASGQQVKIDPSVQAQLNQANPNKQAPDLSRYTPEQIQYMKSKGMIP